MYKGVRIWLECAKCVANQIAQSANTGEEKSPKVYEFGRRYEFFLDHDWTCVGFHDDLMVG
ncbi:hypothetical protein F441_07681 [Phytophthora nicotianae CJ01A1]|uniref:Uncharacterized protein n=4 Tax=Phytophthora nicotianae TaxID=4792 RepID=W2ZID7_PHYNI|nr:hypothetical protein L915_07517 [Phytophthora nicotianae]ETO77045.1 hypothetical protein F444_07720 [Phytophthora nicotianae P1976]ETP18048.1 hypothetical protein F441_07681 [Phytophthora nicotianae CJ01A1]ETP45984.1 hypothetical protein F442_07712 [Phytophthora nicotianae P10297]ETL94772.1 hypothetical protein L917_07337 [Phytophthora nicotianae]